MKITEKIKSFEDACKVLGINLALPNLEAMPESYQKPMLAHYKLCIIAEALNEGWKPNWDDDDEYKYYPWFDMEGSSSGSGFSYGAYDGWAAVTVVGSRLCFKSRELARYVGETFIELYREYFVM